MKTATKRATVYFKSDLHRLLRLKAAASERSVSDLVGEAVRIAFAEDAIDLAAFEERVKEPVSSFESVVKKMKASGKL